MTTEVWQEHIERLEEKLVDALVRIDRLENQMDSRVQDYELRDLQGRVYDLERDRP